VSAQQQQQHATATAVAFTTAGPGQEMLVHFNFNKDRDGLFRPEEHAALQRYVLSQYLCKFYVFLLYFIMHVLLHTSYSIR
jgi:hypothetical protein